MILKILQTQIGQPRQIITGNFLTVPAIIISPALRTSAFHMLQILFRKDQNHRKFCICSASCITNTINLHYNFMIKTAVTCLYIFNADSALSAKLASLHLQILRNIHKFPNLIFIKIVVLLQTFYTFIG